MSGPTISEELLCSRAHLQTSGLADSGIGLAKSVAIQIEPSTNSTARGELRVCEVHMCNVSMKSEVSGHLADRNLNYP